MTSRVLWTSCAALLGALFVSGPVSAQTKKWTLDADFNTGTLNNTQLSPANQVVLGRTPVSKTRLVWSDNFNYGFVVRLDSVTGKQTSRFDSVLTTLNGVSTGVRPANEFCNWSSTGNCPGRVAVDTNGDVWIVNRAFGTQGSLSKFSGDIAHCIDRNNNGKIDTSADVNGDGIIDMNPANGEYFGQNDECILTTIPVGGNNAVPRGVAVDKWGKIWVSTYNEGKVYRFNPSEPVALEATVVAGGHPYSLATGGDWLLISNNAGVPTRVHVTNLTVDTISSSTCPSATYGIVAEPDGSVAYLGGNPVGYAGLYRADFNSKTCTATSNGAHGATTATTLDTQPGPSGPYAWTADYGGTTVSKFTRAGAYVGSYSVTTATAGISYPHGLSVDFDGFLWVVSNISKVGTTYVQQQMTKINPATGAVVGTYSIGFLGGGTQNGAYPVNCATGTVYCDPATPYLYSDFTGVQIDRQAPYTYVGSWDAVYDGGAPQIPWTKVAWNAEPQGAVPQYTALAVSVRAADTTGQLGQAAYQLATSGAAITGLRGRYVQVKADLKGPGWLTSVLSDIAVSGPCGTIGDTCCVKDADCNDGDLCSADTCPVPGGACLHTAIPNCCNTDNDCNDSNACTTDACPGAGQQCAHTPVAGCCNSNTDCNDGDLCTADICSGQGGNCLHPLINGCCNVDLDCTKGNKCSNATCPTPGGFCQGGAIPGCCNTNQDCADTDLCTLDVCDAATSTCSNTKVAGCCNVDTDCNDGDVCTNDHCSGPGGNCVYTSIPGCCSANDPKVGTACDLPVSPHDQPPCAPGAWACKNGSFACVGSVKPAIEICNGVDDDCDGNVDPPTSCPNGQACVTGVCVEPCAPGEFPCASGWQCVNGYCVPTTCDQVVCPAGLVCVAGVCTADGGVGGGSTSSSSSSSSSGATSSGGGAGGKGGAGGAGASGGTGTGATGGAGTGATGTTTGPSTKGSCGCETVGDEGGAHGRLALAALALALAGARRRREGRGAH